MKTTRTHARKRRGPRLAAFSLILLAAAGAFIVWTMNRKTDTYLTDEVAQSFDAKSADTAPKPVAAAPAAAPASSLTPIVTGFKPATAAAKSSWGDSPLVRDFVASPAAYLARKTYFGKAEALEAFLSDRQQVYRYLSHPLIRGVLDDPTLLKWIVGPAVVQGFLSSPAMQDKKAVAMLAKSDLLKGVSRSAGVQALVQDPAFMQAVLVNQQAMGWFMKNPAAADALRDIAPALAKAAGTTGRR